jgi:TonB family protein
MEEGMLQYFALLTAALTLTSGDSSPVVAGRDVPAPRRLEGGAPERPEVARMAGVTGVVLLEVLLDEGGKPMEIKVVRAVPALDKAAIDAVIRWRYEPTLVDGAARRVLLVAALEFFTGPEDALKYYVTMARDQSETVRARLFAVGRLKLWAAKRKPSLEALQALVDDPEPRVAAAARTALQGPE